MIQPPFCGNKEDCIEQCRDYMMYQKEMLLQDEKETKETNKTKETKERNIEKIKQIEDNNKDDRYESNHVRVVNRIVKTLLKMLPIHLPMIYRQSNSESLQRYHRNMALRKRFRFDMVLIIRLRGIVDEYIKREQDKYRKSIAMLCKHHPFLNPHMMQYNIIPFVTVCDEFSFDFESFIDEYMPTLERVVYDMQNHNRHKASMFGALILNNQHHNLMTRARCNAFLSMFKSIDLSQTPSRIATTYIKHILLDFNIFNNETCCLLNLI